MPIIETIYITLEKLLVKGALTQLGEKLNDVPLKRRLTTKLADAATRVLDDMEPLLSAEGLSDYQRELLLNTAFREIETVTESPEAFFEASLTGELLYAKLYEKDGLPMAITDERLATTYRIVFPRIADQFCAIIPTIGQLSFIGQRSMFRRLDNILEKLSFVAGELSADSERHAGEGDVLYQQLHRLALSEVLARLAITGLHGERDFEVSLDDIFVAPKIAPQAREHSLFAESEGGAIAQLFTSGIRTYVVGSPGAGKSTWIDWLQCRALLDDRHKLAIRLRFRDFEKNKLPSHYALIRSIGDVNFGERVSNEHIQKWIKEGKVIFLLDGFDEVIPSRRKEILVLRRN